MKPPPPLVTDSSDVEQQAFARHVIQDREAFERKLWFEQLNSYDGRQFLWECILCHLPGLEEIDGPQEHVLRQLGRRSVWLQLMGEVSQHDELLVQMQKEARARAKRLARTITAQRMATDEE